MYTFNGGLSAPPLLAAATQDGGGGGGGTGNCGSSGSASSGNTLSGGNIPRTPEILNSLIAMTNPLEYSYPPTTTQQATSSNASIHQNQVNTQQSYDSHSSCSASPLDSPASTTAPPTLQQTRSQLIKAGIKLHIQNRRKYSGCESSGNESSTTTTTTSMAAAVASAKRQRKDTDNNLTSEDDTSCHSKSPRAGLTPEDEDRRRRRRERNKIAATKCRMKKRERTANLVNESEVLESQNIDFKNEIRNLESQRRKLMEILQAHSTHCVHHGGYQPLPSVSTLKNCKYLSDIQDFCDAGTAEQPEIKYSQTLKQQQQQQQQEQQQQSDLDFVKQHLLQEEMEFKTTTPTQQMLGYCKPSPTDTNYVLSPDSGFVRSPVDLDSQYHAMEMHPAAHRATTYIPTSEPMLTAQSNNNNNNSALNSNMDGTGDEFILKSELIDSHSPYTSLHSADRFLFEGDVFDDKLTPPTFTSSNHHHHHQQQHQQHHHHHQQQHAVQQHPASNHMMMDTNFDSGSIIKADFLGHNQEFIVMTDGTETQFTDLDSGIIKSLNNGCLV